MKRVQTFTNTCLRRILEIRWSDIISNQNLWKRTRQQPIEVDTFQRRWKWTGHTLRNSSSNITRQALTWNPQVKRKRGRLRNSWRRNLEADMRRYGYTWAGRNATTGPGPWWLKGAYWWPLAQTGLQAMIDWLNRMKRMNSLIPY